MLLRLNCFNGMIPTGIYFRSSCALSPVSLAGVLLPGGLRHTVQSLLQEVLPEGLSHLSQRIHCRRSDQLINMQEPGQSECARWQTWEKKKAIGYWPDWRGGSH